MKNVLRIAALAASLALGACGTLPVAPGAMNGTGTDPMIRITYACSDGQCSPEQIIVVAVAAKVVNEQITPQFSSEVESILTSGALYGGGYAAAGATQPWFYTGANPGAAAGVNGIFGLLGGGMNGLHTYSYAVDASTGTHTEWVLRDWEAGRKIPAAVKAVFPNISELCQGLHVSPSYVRTTNRTPDQVKRFNWHGPVVGEPTK